MSKFDHDLKAILSEEDDAFIADIMDETGYYKTVFKSFRGHGSAMTIWTWCGILIAGGFLIFCVWKFIHADTVKEQIHFATFAILLNSAQIALKLWFNMQLNRRTISREIQRSQLLILRAMQKS
jgi:hypothetical protein